jgi:hypothetical protein
MYMQRRINDRNFVYYVEGEEGWGGCGIIVIVLALSPDDGESLPECTEGVANAALGPGCFKA